MKIKIDKFDVLFSKLIRERDERCMRCKRIGDYHHCSHFWGRGNSATRFSPMNCDRLCYGCHALWEANKQGEYREYMIDKLGGKLYVKLEARARSTVKCGKHEKNLIYAYMKECGLLGLDEYLQEILK